MASFRSSSHRFCSLSWTTLLLLVLGAFYARSFAVLGAETRRIEADAGKEWTEIVSPNVVGDVGLVSELGANHTAAQQSHPLVLTLDMKRVTIRLQLRPERAASTIRTEWLGEKYRSSNEVNRMCMFEGTLDGATEPTATLSICNGITGTIGTPDGDFYIRPVTAEGSHINDPHLVWQNPSGNAANVNLEDDGSWLAKTDSLASGPVVPPSPTDPTRRRRSTRHQGVRYMQVLVVTDQTVVRFHGRDMLEQYVLTQMNIVNSVYHHPSLGVEINVVVPKITVLDDRTTAEIVKENDGTGTLGRFCRWTGREKMNDFYGREQYDVAIYLTRKELGSAGFAPVTGMCMATRSCALIKDDGISSAFVIAHEMAHVMGLSHDGLDNDCDPDPSDGKVMSAMVQSSFNKYHWTRCSREKLAEVLPGLTCLTEKPDDPRWPPLEQPFGRSWSISEQCRQEFGVGFRSCDVFKSMDPCKQLWCSESSSPLVCQTKKGPALPGTSCAQGKWCMDGRCRPISRVAVDGSWASWMSWGSCSRSCASGVRYRIRICSHPRPMHGGRDCEGRNEDYQICNKQSCPFATDYRAEQCRQHDTKTFTRMRRHHWLPVENIDEARKCKLTCVSKETGDHLESEANVVDGTRCSYSSPHDLCIRGKCHKVGCDGVENSYAEDDICMVCGGRGDTCKVVSGTYKRKMAKKEYHPLLNLPAKTRNIVVKERYFTSHLAHFIAVRDKTTGEFLLNGNHRMSSSKRFIAHGTRFVYTRNGRGESLTARGPLLAPVEVMIYSLSSSIPTSIYYEYTIPRYLENSIEAQPIHMPEKPKYVWRTRGWGPCSKLCGGGTRHKRIVCIKVTTKDEVDKGLCSLFTRPKDVSRSCHKRSCTKRPYRWRAQKWGECSATCGVHGSQQRRVYCLQMNRYGNRMHWKVNSVYCSSLRMPKQQKPCNRKACPGEWKTSTWSKCSARCGIGLQKRRVYCQKRRNGNRYRCPSKHPAGVRYCHAPPCQAQTTTTPTTTEAPTTTTETTTTRRRPTYGVRARSYVTREEAPQTESFEYNPYATPVPPSSVGRRSRQPQRVPRPAPRIRHRPDVTPVRTPDTPAMPQRQRGYVDRDPRIPRPDSRSRDQRRAYPSASDPRRRTRGRAYVAAPAPRPVLSPVQRHDTPSRPVISPVQRYDRRAYVAPTPPRTAVQSRPVRVNPTPRRPARISGRSSHMTMASYSARTRNDPSARTGGQLCAGDKSVFCKLGANSAHCRLRPYWDVCCYSCSRFRRRGA